MASQSSDSPDSAGGDPLRDLDAELESAFGATFAAAVAGTMSPFDVHRFETRLEREEHEARRRSVRFITVADWHPLPYRHDQIQIAFPERLVAVGERNGPDNYGGVYTPAQFLGSFAEFLTSHGWDWLVPYLRRLSDGEDIQHELLDRVRRDGTAAPSVTEWRIDPDDYWHET